MADTSADVRPQRDRLNPVVFYGSAIVIVAFSVWTIAFTESANSAIQGALGWVSATFGWFYFVAVLAYLVFVVAIGLSRFGQIRLGPQHSRPEFNLATWAAMLFSAGIGIDLIFFCVVEPVTQFLAPPIGEGGTPEAAREALKITFLHWGLSGWGVYTLVGMSLAFFSYRYGLPLSIRSTLYPLVGKRIHGPIGHSVDGAAVLGTIFGIATSLGIGIIQLNFGLNYMFGIPDGTLTQVLLATIIVVFAAISATTGVERGIRRLSEFNMLVALLLMLFVLFAGETMYLLNALVMNTGDYLSDFLAMSTNTYALDPPVEWLNAWTVFFWAWWIAWGPFVGLFLARISRGRTIRQFVAGSLLIPLAFMMGWMSIIGNSAIDIVMNGGTEFGQQAMENPGSAIYLFLEGFPWASVTTVVITVLSIVFFVTSGDSGSLVLSNLSSILVDPERDAPSWMRILWAAIIGVLTVGLLLADGLTALQSTVVIMGLPFAVVLLLMMYGLAKALRAEALKEDAASQNVSPAPDVRAVAPSDEDGAEHWAHRLRRAMTFPSRDQVQRYMHAVVRAAMTDIQKEMLGRGISADTRRIEKELGGEQFRVDFDEEQAFCYEVRVHRYLMPSFAVRPHQGASSYYRPEVHLVEGGQGYDLTGWTKAQVISDILDQYERHLSFLHAQREANNRATTSEQDHE